MFIQLHKGSPATKDFYDRVGWRRRDGVLVDTLLFGSTGGPIRDALEFQRNERLVQAVGAGSRMAELGCGGSPAVSLARQCASYTAVDFSSVGLREAAAALVDANVSFETIEADITRLPFEDGAFDVVYSAHAIYHIDSVAGQVAAFQEAMRIVRPGGRAIFVMANPFPILFPLRLIRRVLAMTPGLNAALNRFREKPVLPYLPLSMGWMRRQLRKWGDVRITGHAAPSHQFDRRVSETATFGRLAWRLIHWLETDHADAAAQLGCYVVILVDKSEQAAATA